MPVGLRAWGCVLRRSFIEGSDAVQYSFDNRFFPDRGISHQVKAVAIRPLDPKVLHDEGGAIPVNRFRKLHRFLLAPASRLESQDLFFEWCVDENVEGIASILQVVSRATPHNNAVPRFSGDLYHPLGYFADALGIDDLRVRGLNAAFIAASQKPFE
jgi:hypothetical protein